MTADIGNESPEERCEFELMQNRKQSNTAEEIEMLRRYLRVSITEVTKLYQDGWRLRNGELHK